MLSGMGKSIPILKNHRKTMRYKIIASAFIVVVVIILLAVFGTGESSSETEQATEEIQ